jgi:hypothetical protein
MEWANREHYAARAIQGCYDDVAGAEEGTRNPTLNSVAYSLGRRFVSEGTLERLAVEYYLIEASKVCGLDRDKGGLPAVRATIASGLNAGIRAGHAERGAGGEGVADAGA